MHLFNTHWLREHRDARPDSYAAPAYGRRYGRRDDTPGPARVDAPPPWPTLRLRGIGRAEAAAIRAYFDRAA
jgi:hypothetical protein